VCANIVLLSLMLDGLYLIMHEKDHYLLPVNPLSYNVKKEYIHDQ
jgi:hypothetical protein